MKEKIDWKNLVSLHKEKLQPIKVFLVDVDGILTNGMVFYGGAEVGFNRFFHVADGHAFKFLMAAGLKVGVLSGGDSLGLRKRMEYLRPNYLFLGNEDKRAGYLEVLRDSGCSDKEVLYMGDDLFDIPILKRVGFAATAPHANPEVKAVTHYVTTYEGGSGCVREVADLLRMAQGFFPHYPDFDEMILDN